LREKGGEVDREGKKRINCLWKGESLRHTLKGERGRGGKRNKAEKKVLAAVEGEEKIPFRPPKGRSD